MNIVDQCKAANALGGKTARACDSCLLKRLDGFALRMMLFSANPVTFPCIRLISWQVGTKEFGLKHRRLRAVKGILLQLGIKGSLERPEPHDRESRLRGCSHRPTTRFHYEREESDDGHDLNLAELLSTCDDDLAEFAADVESLLGTGAEEDSGCPIYCKDEDNNELLHGKGVKIEEEEDDDDEEVQAVIACHFNPALDMELNWDFDYASSMAHQETKNVAAIETTSSMDSGSESHVKKRMLLRLNYEAVIAAWAAQGSPWTNGVRPHFNLDEFMVTCLEGDSHPSCVEDQEPMMQKESKSVKIQGKEKDKVVLKEDPI
ncbi:UNVERIFIED_CONTAM: Zinc finger protein CONSTANS-LIKE 16 [Sesamum calycinum]|uniref:Zinc finger protein CONSTANS-LIKE 16 n=1 Tax=Sesamum calycinum TaxID=2727403 RepID=A0AAW2NIL1_9LAMI